MTLKELMEYSDELVPNPFSFRIKTAMVNQIEAEVIHDVFLLSPEDVVQYDWEADQDAVLFLKPPHTDVYKNYMKAMLYREMGEAARYNNENELFNESLRTLCRCVAETVRPADGRAILKGYYLSAYAIAVKHGYKGTEEQWLASLNGAEVDKTLLKSGMAADALIVGNMLRKLQDGSGEVNVDQAEMKTAVIGGVIYAQSGNTGAADVGPVLDLYGMENDDPVVLRNVGQPKIASDAANKAYVDDRTIFEAQDGMVCVPVAENAAVVGGVNSVGCQWYALEYAEEAAAISEEIPEAVAYAQMDEPYLKEWGWQCCLKDAANGDKTAMELYRWLYRCIRQRFAIARRTIVIVGLDGVKRTYTCATNGGATVHNGNPVDGMYYLNIPLVQFPNLTQQYLKNMLCRVKEDNPDLLYTRMPNTSFLSNNYEGDPYGMGVDGGYACVYSMEVTNERAAEMMVIVNAAVDQIKDKLSQVHGITAGQRLTVAQKVTVAKVIHDYICTFAHGQYEAEGQDASNYWTSILYSVFDPQLKSRCSGYTQAFNYVARMYGIESIYMSGVGYIDTNDDGDYADFGESGGHAWVAVRLSDEPYGTYPNDASKWSCADLYWDEPTHEEVVSGATPSRDDVIWDYFLNVENIFPKVGSERYQRAHRSITTTSGYGMYPTERFDGTIAQPSLNMPYDGDTNEWEE